MNSYIKGLFTATCLFLAFQQNAFACSCGLPNPDISLDEQVQNARKKSNSVFEGEVLDIKITSDFGVMVKIKIKSSWKGIKDSQVDIITGKGDGDCGYPFKIGETYLIYAYKTDDDQLLTNICQRTKLLSESKDDIRVLERSRKRKPASPNRIHFVQHLRESDSTI